MTAAEPKGIPGNRAHPAPAKSGRSPAGAKTIRSASHGAPMRQTKFWRETMPRRPISGFAAIVAAAAVAMTVSSAAEARCLKPVRELGGWSGWVNRCSHNVGVIYYDQGDCPRGFYKKRKYPCALMVRARGRNTDNFKGFMDWYECDRVIPTEISYGNVVCK